jgi:hypothetical protein
MMKRLVYAASLLLFAACSNDFVDDGSNFEPTPANVTSFTATLSESEMRTSYGESDGSVYPLYWTAGDAVTISNGSAVSNYTAKEGGVSIQSTTLEGGSLAEANAYYGFYPASRVVSFSGSTVTSHMKSMLMSSEAQVNMENAFMAAKSGDEKASSLKFVPLTTAVDISFTAPEGVLVQKIVLSSESYLAGTFSYNIATSTTTLADPSKLSKRLVINVDTPAAGEYKYTIFLLPNFADKLRVDVVTDKGMLGQTSSKALTAGARHTFALGALPASGYKANASAKWMSYLPDNMYLSMVSMPGSHDACTSTIATTLQGKVQDLDLAAQFAAGVRLFDLRPTCRYTSSGGLFGIGGTHTSNDTDLIIYHGTSSTGVKFADALADIKELIDANPTETVVLLVHHESSHLVYLGDSQAKCQAQWASQIPLKLNASGLQFVKAFNSDVTLGEARGKVVVIARDDYNGGYHSGKVNWGDNQTRTNHPILIDTGSESRKTLTYQDTYNDIEVSEKQSRIEANITAASSSTTISEWYMNHVSFASSPESSANTLNAAAMAKIQSVKGRVGMVLMDFCGNATTNRVKSYELQQAIISANNNWLLPVKY